MFYGLPKIHKGDLKWRPISGAFNAPTKVISVWLSKLYRYWLQKLHQNLEPAFTVLRDDLELLQLTQSTDMTGYTQIASGDFTTFYSKITPDEIEFAIRKLSDIEPPPFPALTPDIIFECS